MKNRKYAVILLAVTLAAVFISFRENDKPELYLATYKECLGNFERGQNALVQTIAAGNLEKQEGIAQVKQKIHEARMQLKLMDFWMRYLEPLAYKKINSPLPVEWETEVFEKFEKPYKREGAGLMLAEAYLEEEQVSKDSLLSLIQQSVDMTKVFAADSITTQLETYHHFYLCNRLYLLNLAAIYTTGFECPEPAQVVPELRYMLAGINNVYRSFNESFAATALTKEYMQLYGEAISFVNKQPEDNSEFDHFIFIRDYVNPLFVINQQLINKYKVVSKSLVDYSLNKTATSIFSKELYDGQNPKGIFLRVRDTAVLAEIERLGKLLFYDPVLSGNNQRSCASCHKPTEFFTDTMVATAFLFDKKGMLPRNSPTLLNAQYNHLLMLDGKHISLQAQGKDVICNPIEMASDSNEALEKVMSCKEYKTAFTKLLQHTPQEKEVTLDHIVSAITLYYGKFSTYYSSFDEAMNERKELTASERHGFNLFMSKAQCATCHFVPQFNGVKPPYIGSEFEVIGVPGDTAFRQLSTDKGRFAINPATETFHAFRTGTVRNSANTKPYMHNGVFTTMEQVIDFYDAGGGAGRGLAVDNQTLPADSLKLTKQEKKDLISFISTLNEKIITDMPPRKLPSSKMKALNTRKIGGVY
jgi:cytochrome c peroxidase